MFTVHFFWFANAIGQTDKAKTYIINSLANCESAISEIKNAILYLDSINLQNKDNSNLERFIRLSESEAVAGKRMLEFSEAAVENALDILDTLCQVGANSLNPVLSQTHPIFRKLNLATKQLNLWLNNKEKRAKNDWIASSKTMLIAAKSRLEKLRIDIEKAKLMINNCPVN